MDERGRRLGILGPVNDDLFHFAPVPLIYRNLDAEEASKLNRELVDVARTAFTDPALEVPDRRHITDLGVLPDVKDETWSEAQPTPVGIWHRVPTNNLLDVPADAVKRLRSIIENRYLFAISAVGQTVPHEQVTPTITESWIQFYRDGDDKVLHNHERYGPPYPRYPWAGAYYVSDGTPDATMPYAGVLSFRIRNENYFFRPRAGLLMLWPADVLHEVHPFYGGSERIVINFNINGGFGGRT